MAVLLPFAIAQCIPVYQRLVQGRIRHRIASHSESKLVPGTRNRYLVLQSLEYLLPGTWYSRYQYHGACYIEKVNYRKLE